MKKYKKQIYLFLFVSLLIVIGSFTFLFINFRRQIHFQNENLEVNENLILTDSLIGNSLQLESDKRAFQLTSEMAYLKNFYGLKRSMKSNIERLKDNFNSPESSNPLSQLDSLLEVQIKYLDNSITVYVTKGLDSSVAFMQLKDRKNARELLNQRLWALKGDLQNKLNENISEIKKLSNQNVKDLLILLSIFVLLMFVAAYVLKKSQQKIIKNHIKFKEAQKIAKIGSWEWGIASDELKWSTEEFRLFGEDRRTFALTFQGYLSHLSADEQKRTQQLIKDALEGKKEFAIEHEIIRKDGTVLMVFEQGAVLFDKNNKPVGMFGTTQDISERKRVEEEITAERQLLRTLIDNIPDLIYIKDTKRRKVMANKADMEFMGVKSESQFKGKTDQELFSGNGKLQGHNNDLIVINTGQPIINSEEEFMDEKAGSHRYLLSSKIPLFDVTGKLYGLLGIGRDITQLKKAEKDFLEAQKKLQSIFENIADGIYQSTVEGKFITANPSMAKILGYDSVAELISSVTDIGEQLYLNPEDRKLMARLLTKYGHIENFEVSLLTKDKNIVWVSESTRAVREDNGTIKYYEGTLKDITERKRAEETLDLMQKKYQAIFDNTAIGIYQSTLDGRFIMANPSMSRIFGYDSPAELIRSVTNISTQVFADPDERKKMIELISIYGHLENFELQAYSKDKEIIWVSANIRAIRDERGGIAYFEGLLENITERKRAEEQLMDISNRLQLAITATNIGIWDWDVVRNSTEWDEKMFDIYNVDENDHANITDEWESALHPEDLNRVSTELQMALKGEKDFDSEFRIVWKNKSIHHVKANAIVLRDQTGNPLRMIGTNTDITERKEAEESILQLNRNLDQFANITAHDLQEPIRMVSGFLGLLEKRYGEVLDEQGKSYIFRAKDGADRMTILIRDLLEFSRSGNKAAKKETVDLNTVMDLVKKDLTIVTSDTKTVLCLPNDLPLVTGTPSALYRLFLNLISNGIKFRKKHTAPEIKLCMKELEDSWEFTLQDNGIGVAEKDQPRLFQAFQRLHRKEDYPGTGLGLVTCKKIVEMHGGKIWMTSELGKGTAFYFTILKDNKLMKKAV